MTEATLETWGAGVDIHTVDTLSSLFQFRTHFLVRFVPNKLPLPLAQLMVLNDESNIAKDNQRTTLLRRGYTSSTLQPKKKFRKQTLKVCCHHPVTKTGHEEIWPSVRKVSCCLKIKYQFETPLLKERLFPAII